jgi:hypothetical protein
MGQHPLDDPLLLKQWEPFDTFMKNLFFHNFTFGYNRSRHVVTFVLDRERSRYSLQSGLCSASMKTNVIMIRNVETLLEHVCITNNFDS